MGVRFGKRALNLSVPAQARARADLCPRKHVHVLTCARASACTIEIFLEAPT